MGYMRLRIIISIFDFYTVISVLPQKGQHLEPFIMNFINSCESPKPKPSKPELTILSPTSENNKKVLHIALAIKFVVVLLDVTFLL